MRRRVVPANPHAMRASGDRWLFGYADIVTLLFACFASLYASGLATSEAAPAVVAPILIEASTPPAAALPAPPTAPSAMEDELEAVLGRDGNLPGIEVTASLRGLVISLPEAGSFPPGTAQLSAQARTVILELADTLRDLPNLIRVEGHTDDVPISTPEFASNWELSTSRATRVVQFLIEECDIDPVRLAAAGYAEYRPRLDNTTSEARARNRRVDIVVLDPVAARREEPEEIVR